MNLFPIIGTNTYNCARILAGPDLFFPGFRPCEPAGRALISFNINFYAPARLGPDGLESFYAMQPDYEDYWADLDGYELSDEEKRQLIHTLWTMMESFVDSAFGVHPVQQAIKARPAGDSNPPRVAIESKKQQPRKQKALSGTFKGKAGRKRKP
jgi:hypothetical protein